MKDVKKNFDLAYVLLGYKISRPNYSLATLLCMVAKMELYALHGWRTPYCRKY